MAVQISGNDITVPRDGTFSRNVSIAGTLTYEDVTNVDSIGLVTARNGIEVGASPGVAASISVDGNAIFSGITTIGGNVKVGTGITLSPDGDVFATGITTISENLKVGTGVTISPDGDVFATGVCTATSFSGDGSNLTGISAGTALSGSTDNTVTTVTGANAIQGEANLTFDGTNLTVSTGNLVIGTSGKGIDFSAASGSASGSTSAVLDDYEEGTYSPFITQGMDPDISSNTGAYTYLKGYYRKIGTLVEFNFYIQITNDSSYEGDGTAVKIAVPFTQDYANQKRGWGLLTYQTMQGINVSSNGIHFQVYNSAADLLSGATAVTMGNGTAQHNRYIIGGGFYHST